VIVKWVLTEVCLQGGKWIYHCQETGDETLTAVAVAWDVMVYRLVEVYKHFRGMYCPPASGSEGHSVCKLLVSLLKYSSEDGGNTFL
jgi:hypothetical protein